MHLSHMTGLRLAYQYSADLGRHFTKESNSLLTLKETPARAKHGSGLFFTTVCIMQMDRERNVIMRSSLLSDSLRTCPVTPALQELIQQSESIQSLSLPLQLFMKQASSALLFISLSTGSSQFLHHFSSTFHTSLRSLSVNGGSLSRLISF